MPSMLDALDLAPHRTRTNLAPAELVERALEHGEGRLAANGALVCRTGDRTGRSPNDKYLEDTPDIHARIWWGRVNQPITPEGFNLALKIAIEHLNSRPNVYVFEGYAGADERHRLGVRVITEQAWHALFASTLFIRRGSRAAPQDRVPSATWTVLNASRRRLTPDEAKAIGVRGPVLIAQSLSRRIVVILGTEYAGEMKKSIFYAMNYDMPELGVFPMHCSANVGPDSDHDVALFFGLSGTGKTTLSADPQRRLIGDDEHGWSDRGVFNFEGGCYAKCIKLSRTGEPQIWDAIRFGSVLENVVFRDGTREPDYESAAITENTRATYPLEHIEGAVIPSVAGHPRHVIFLTADAFGVLPPIARLTLEQAEYYFINGYTSKLAGTETGVTEPQPNFSACFGAPFLPRPPIVYAQMLAQRMRSHGVRVWLLNTGWTGGPYGVGHRFRLDHTRAMVRAILGGVLNDVPMRRDAIFGLNVPGSVPGVPAEILDPRSTWKDAGAYETQARKLAALFRANDQTFDMPANIRAAGPPCV